VRISNGRAGRSSQKNRRIELLGNAGKAVSLPFKLPVAALALESFFDVSSDIFSVFILEGYGFGQLTLFPYLCVFHGPTCWPFSFACLLSLPFALGFGIVLKTINQESRQEGGRGLQLLNWGVKSLDCAGVQQHEKKDKR
jgi:hypothetical protein